MQQLDGYKTQGPFKITPEMESDVEDGLSELTKTLARKPVQALTAERSTTHGDFRTNARLSQKMKTIFRLYDGWDALDDVEKEVLDMISLKISRILSGKSLERQHWEDIEGYAHLALKECK